MTNGHIDAFKELFVSSLTEDEDVPTGEMKVQDIPDKAFDEILRGHEVGLRAQFRHVVREFAKITNGFTIPRMKVDRTRTPQEALNALKAMRQEIDPEVAVKMPGGNPQKETIVETTNQQKISVDSSFAETIMRPNTGEGDMFHFFMAEGATDDEVTEKLALRGLRPADAYELCKINEINGDLAYRYPNTTIWKIDGVWCFIAFYVHLGQPYVKVAIHADKHWRPGYWVVGVSLTT